MSTIVHTLQFSIQLNKLDADSIYKSLDYTRQNTSEMYYFQPNEYLKLDFYPRYNGITVNRLVTFINADKIINAKDIDKADIQKQVSAIYDIYSDCFYRLFKYTDISKTGLKRIDYKLDFREHNNYKDIYIKLIKKSYTKFRYLHKEKEYDTSIYYECKSYNINIYDKQAENNNPNDNFIRYELQMKRPKIRYESKKHGLIDTLENYYSKYDRDNYIFDHLKKVLFIGDYYNQYQGNLIIQKNYNKSMTKKLNDFRNHISKHGIDKAKENYGSPLFNTHKKRLEDIGVNPIQIPNNWNVTYLINPISENINENTYQ